MSLTLNFTEENLSTNTNYEPVPAGSYNATVYEVKQEEVRSGDNAGKPRLNVQFRLTGDGVENRRVFSYIPLYVAKDAWKAASFFSSLGYDVKAGAFKVPEVADMLGKSIGVRVKVGVDQNGQPRNEVGGFDKPADGAAALAAMGAKPVGDVF